MIYLDPLERKRLAEKQARGDVRLTSRERGYLMQKEQDARAEGKRLATIVEADNRKVIEASTPDHLKRPRNLAQEAIDQYTKDGRYVAPELKRRLATLQEQAAAREKEIDKEMEAKAKAHAIANDPSVQDALEHCESASQRLPELAEQFAELRGLLLGGGPAVLPDYWRRAAEVTAAAREKTAEAVDRAGKTLDDATRQYCESKIAFECAESERDYTAKRGESHG